MAAKGRKAAGASKPAARKKTATAAKKPAAKKPPAKKPPAKPRTRKAALKDAPSGRHLPAVKKMLRDSRMVVRRHQGWTWEMVAAEAGITEKAARNACKDREKDEPITLRTDPAVVVENLLEQYQLSIADYEAMAVAYAEKNGPAAVGAKKAADETRERIVRLLQATGRMPQELGALRHLIDLRAIGVRMLDTMDRFEAQMNEIAVDAETKAAIEAGVLDVRTTFYDLIGMDGGDAPRQLPSAA